MKMNLLTFVLLFAFSAAISGSEVPNFTSLDLGNKRFYLGLHFKAAFMEAAEFCSYHGMSLATVNSQREHDQLRAYMIEMGIGDQFVWVSGTDLAHEGKFVWLSSGRPLIYKNFMPGQPDNAHDAEHCLEIRPEGWNDTPCAVKSYFVCEF